MLNKSEETLSLMPNLSKSTNPIKRDIKPSPFNKQGIILGPKHILLQAHAINNINTPGPQFMNAIRSKRLLVSRFVCKCNICKINVYAARARREWMVLLSGDQWMSD